MELTCGMTMASTAVDRNGKNTMSCSMAVNCIVMDNVAVSAGRGMEKHGNDWCGDS